MIDVPLQALAKARIPIDRTNFTIHAFDSGNHYSPHLALTLGELKAKSVPLRIHSECLTGDVFGSARCDCQYQLKESLNYIMSIGQGIVIYLRQEGRGIGLVEKLKAYSIQDGGLDTFDANVALGHPPDAREFHTAVQILKTFETESIELITQNPEKVRALESAGILVNRRIALRPPQGHEVARYLDTKTKRFGHIKDFFEEE